MAKRILIYTNHFLPEQFKINEIVEWIPHTFEVRIITCIPNYPKGRFFKGYGLHTFSKIGNRDNIIINRLPIIPRGNGSKLMLVLNYSSYFISCFFFTLLLMLFKKKYDYIFVHHTSPILIAIHPIIYGSFYDSKKYLWDLDLWPETLEAVNTIKSKIIINFLSKMVKKIYSFYDKILIGSNGFRDIVRNRYSKEIIYFPNWAEKEIENNNCSQNLNLKVPKNKKIIMYTGNIGYSQNFEPLVETISILKKNNYWIFIGDGRLKNQFKSIIKKRNLDSCCMFIDQVSISKIPCYAKYADFMFLSLRSNYVFSKTIPAKLQSYMALAKPVIGVISGEGAEVINQSNCGIVQESSDYKELANQILKLNKISPKESIKIGQNGRDYYELFFSRQKRKEQFLKLFI